MIQYGTPLEFGTNNNHKSIPYLSYKKHKKELTFTQAYCIGLFLGWFLYSLPPLLNIILNK
jgi:hypothetical protein